jgi:hypothetical protein
VCRVGVTPSDACGLGLASSSAKGWVLAMLARESALCVALVPRKGAPFSPAAYARPQKTAPEGADAGTTPAGPPGQSERIKIMTRKFTVSEGSAPSLFGT